MAGEANLVFFSRQKSPKCALGGGEVSTSIYQHPPTISWGEAKMEAEKWDMDGEPKDERNQSKGQRTKTM